MKYEIVTLYFDLYNKTFSTKYTINEMRQELDSYGDIGFCVVSTTCMSDGKILILMQRDSGNKKLLLASEIDTK